MRTFGPGVNFGPRSGPWFVTSKHQSTRQLAVGRLVSSREKRAGQVLADILPCGFGACMYGALRGRRTKRHLVALRSSFLCPSAGKSRCLDCACVPNSARPPGGLLVVREGQLWVHVVDVEPLHCLCWRDASSIAKVPPFAIFALVRRRSADVPTGRKGWPCQFKQEGGPMALTGFFLTGECGFGY